MLKEVTFRRHDPQGKLKEYLQQIGFTWRYAHEDLFLRELSQHQVFVKSNIPTPKQMMHIDKEAEKQKDNIEKNKVTIKQNILARFKVCEENLSSSSMSMYSLDSGEEASQFL